MLAGGGGVVGGREVDGAVVVAVVAGAVEAAGAALGPDRASFVEQAPRATTRTSAEAPITIGRRLTNRDSITPHRRSPRNLNTLRPVNALGGPAVASAILLAIGGTSKLLRPANTSHALRGLRLPAAPSGVRLLAAAEIGVAVGALAGGGRYAWLLVAAAYLGFAGFVVFAMRRGGAVSSCGCFGAPDTPPTLVHVLVTTAASAVALATAGEPPGPLLDALVDMPLLGLPFLLVTGCCVWFAHAAVTVLPRTVALAKHG